MQSPLEKTGKTALYTQDTKISYCQIEMKNDPESIFLPESVSDKISGRKVKYIRGISYQSINAYWLYPKGKSKTQTIANDKGSGLSFGVSILKFDLVAAVKQLNPNPTNPSTNPNPSNPGNYKSTIDTIAKILRISSDTFQDFLSELNHQDLEDKIETTGVLIESNFPLETKTQLTVTLPDTVNSNSVKIYELESLWAHTGIKNFLSTLETTPLDKSKQLTLRLRARMTDHFDSAFNQFDGTLKFKVGLNFGPGVEFNLNNIREAGREGVFDIARKTYPAQRTEDDDVPPTTLFFQ